MHSWLAHQSDGSELLRETTVERDSILRNGVARIRKGHGWTHIYLYSRSISDAFFQPGAKVFFGFKSIWFHQLKLQLQDPNSSYPGCLLISPPYAARTTYEYVRPAGLAAITRSLSGNGRHSGGLVWSKSPQESQWLAADQSVTCSRPKWLTADHSTPESPQSYMDDRETICQSFNAMEHIQRILLCHLVSFSIMLSSLSWYHFKHFYWTLGYILSFP